jgi:hypothetical protein
MPELGSLFGGAISIQKNLGLHDYDKFERPKITQEDNDKAAGKSFTHGQRLAALEERMEFNILAGRKLLLQFEKLNQVTPEPHRHAFVEAGKAIENRLEYLVEAFEFQMPRLRRAKVHTTLNQTGVSARTVCDNLSQILIPSSLKIASHPTRTKSLNESQWSPKQSQ